VAIGEICWEALDISVHFTIVRAVVSAEVP
jgi:hypothetical protein